REFIFPILFMPEDEITVFIKESSAVPRFSIKIWEKTAFQEYDQYNLFFWGGFTGLMLVMAIYNLFIFISIRDEAYLLYVCFVICSLVNQLCLSGFFYQFMGDFPWPKGVLPLASGLVIIFIMFFFSKILALKSTERLIFIPYWIFFTIVIADMLICLINHKVGITLLLSSITILIPFAFIAIIYKLKHRAPQAGLIAIAWGMLLILTMSITLNRMKLLPIDIPDLENFGTPIGSAWEVVWFSLALAEKIKEERRQKERAQAQAIENLRTADKVKRQIFANTSHELRTPLNGILGFIDLIRRGRYGIVGQGVLNQIVKIQTLATSLKQQVNTILELAKMGEKRLSGHPSKIIVNEIVDEIRVLGEGLSISSDNNEFSINKSWQDDIDPIIVNDREKLFIILRNLIANAFKFKDQTRKNRVSLNFSMNSDGSLVVTVADTGIGIDEKDHKKIYEEFFQVDGEGRRRYEGSGLGLSIVKSYLDIVGGRITLSSKIAAGSVFTLTVPSMENTALEAMTFESTSVGSESEIVPVITEEKKEEVEKDLSIVKDGETEQDYLPGTPSNGLKVLVIDDHRYNCEVISDILIGEGYEVEIALSGTEGIGKLESFQPNLVLLDMMMPNFSGEDVIKYIKTEARFSDIPVIFITARSSEEDIINGLQMGADDYLAKPILSDELRLRVGNMLSRIMYTRSQSEKKTIEKNVAIAQNVHQAFSDIFQKIPHIVLSEHYCPAETAGGDWRAIFYNEQNGIMDIFMGDVTGHGISSAIYSVALGSSVKSTIAILNDMTAKSSLVGRVKTIAGYLNAAIIQTSNILEKMVTMAIVSIDLASGDGAFLSAGHHPCIIKGKESARLLQASGDPLGIDSTEQFECCEFKFSEGDILFLYTDGLIENRGGNGKRIRLNSIKKIICEHDEPEAIKSDILGAVKIAWGQEPCEDDYTFMVIKRI
ncbi:MAG: SpoIIE family protein phosphatase, partial [Oligoflexales bacterium]|nr:SpoIIE family protein phosphatase [Oligoflexales bacterium]